jgi:hypothetical protein
MKYIKKFESNLYRIPKNIIDNIWDELWTKHKFYYPLNQPNLIFESIYDKEHDDIAITISRFSGEKMSYVNIGTRYFYGTDEEKQKFVNWLYDLRLVID